jgi:hypothetical protein
METLPQLSVSDQETDRENSTGSSAVIHSLPWRISEPAGASLSSRPFYLDAPSDPSNAVI